MFSRLSDDEKIGNPLDTEWIAEVQTLLDQVYLEQREQYVKNFKVYGFKYDKEVIFIISFLNENEPHIAPITCLLSLEPEKIERKAFLKHIVDATGMLFDDIFHKLTNKAPDSEVYFNDWREVKVGKETTHYKISRENIELSIQASILLAQNPDTLN